MVQQRRKVNLSETARETYWVRMLESREDANRIIDFFLSEDSFDDRNFTKGETIMLKNLPKLSLKDSGFQFWYTENSENEIVGVISLRENEQKSGGYLIDYVAVHKQARNRGIAHRLMGVVIKHVQLLNGRYIQVNTCDTILYEDARRLFEKEGFSQVGSLRDYYFEGEGMLIYYKKMG